MHKSTVVVATFTATALLAEIAIGGTVPLAAGNSKRRINTVVNTTTKLVTPPVVEVKVEATNTWVASPAETVASTVTQYIEEPVRPVLPVFTALTIFDCNGNGVGDSVEIANGAADFDGDAVLDACETKLGDLNLNGTIDQQDVNILVGWWGIANPLYGDLNNDNVVDAIDLGIILGRFGVVVY